MASNISVTISADVADLQAKLALTQSALKETGASMRDLANQVRAAGDAVDSNLRGQFEAAAAQTARLKAEMQALNAQMRESTTSTAGLGASIAAANEALGGMQAEIGAITGLFAKIGELFLVGFGVERVVELGLHVAELGHQLEVASQQTGLTVEQLSALRVAAVENGTTFETVTRLVTRLGSTLQESLQTPSDKAGRALRALGFSGDYVSAHSNDLGAVLQLIAQRLDEFSEGGNKAAIEAAIFGQRLGPELTPVLKTLAQDGFDGLISRGEKLGVVLDKEAAEKAAASEKAFKDFSLAVDGLENALGSLMLPTLTSMATTLTTIAEKARELLEWLQKIPAAAIAMRNALPTALGGVLPGSALLPLLGGSDQHGATGSFEPGGKPAPGIAEAPDTSARDARDLERELNQELRERLALIDEATQASNAYYTRLAADTRLAAAQGKISEQEEYEQLVTLENEKFDLAQRDLQKKLAFYTEDDAEYHKLLSQIQIATEQHYAALDQLGERWVQQQKQQAQEVAREYERAMQPVLDFTRSIVSGVISQHQTLGAAVIAATQQMVAREIELDATWALRHLLLGNTVMAADKARDQGGLLSFILADHAKTAATQSGNIQRAASDASAQVGFLGGIGQMLAKWLGLEASKTAATEGGNAARAAEDEASALASQGLDIIRAVGAIQVQASIGAAAAFADSAELGPEGLAAAPGVATATYGTILGWASGLGGGLGTAAKGALLDQDQFVMAHARELILPANISDGLRGLVDIVPRMTAMMPQIAIPTFPRFGLPSPPSFGASFAGAAAVAGGGGMTVNHSTHVTFRISGGAGDWRQAGKLVERAARNGHADLMRTLKKLR